MLSKRIIPCLDVLEGKVVKGVQFRKHEVVGNVNDLALRYRDEGADELVFYDIAASSQDRHIDPKWVSDLAKILDIPFCVAGGVRSRDIARMLLNSGADKISINSPALERPELITELAAEFGTQCVVVGVDSKKNAANDYRVFLYTGDEAKTLKSAWSTREWLIKVQELGAGEVVLNCMDSDGTGGGYDLQQLQMARQVLSVPLVASGGAKRVEDFMHAFANGADACLAAGVFHRNELKINQLKEKLYANGIEVRKTAELE